MTFQIIFRQNFEITAVKRVEERTKVDFLFERSNILSNSQLIKLGQNIRKSQLFKKALTQISKNSQFLGQRWDHQFPYNLSAHVVLFPSMRKKHKESQEPQPAYSLKWFHI